VLPKSRFTAETQRALREYSYDPIGRRRSDHKLSPFGDRCKVAFHSCGVANNACIDAKEGFLFGGLSPPNKKSLLCALHACGENSILDKKEGSFEMSLVKR